MFLLFYLRASSLFLYSSWCSWLNRVAGALSRCKNLIPHTCLGVYSTRSTIVTVTFSRYILVWECTLEQSSHTTEWARTLRFGAGLLVPPQGAAARCCCQSAVCVLELGCFAAAGVPLQGAASSRCCRVLFALWSLFAGVLQGAAAECRCLCCCSGKLRQVLSKVQSFFSFSLFVFRTRWALVGWYAFKPRLGLVLASFWLRLFLLMLRLRWCCEQVRAA